MQKQILIAGIFITILLVSGGVENNKSNAELQKFVGEWHGVEYLKGNLRRDDKE